MQPAPKFSQSEVSALLPAEVFKSVALATVNSSYLERIGQHEVHVHRKRFFAVHIVLDKHVVGLRVIKIKKLT